MIDMFDYFDILFPVLIALAFGVFGFAVARGIVTWNKNNHSPPEKHQSAKQGDKQQIISVIFKIRTHILAAFNPFFVNFCDFIDKFLRICTSNA